MQTIHYSVNSVMPNTTGVVGVQLLDLDRSEPTVALIPIIGWAMADGIEPQPIYLWNKADHIDAVYDPATGHVHTQFGECWANLQDAVQDLVKMRKLAEAA
ncbi:MAG: hypothetical protein EBR82_38825 [Caulobacteraceae bacterium]|nr:hypothetical protein [Caulobacteraceae bacterium]